MRKTLLFSFLFIFDSSGSQTFPFPFTIIVPFIYFLILIDRRTSILLLFCIKFGISLTLIHYYYHPKMLDLFLVTQPSNHKSPASDQIPSITTIDRPCEPFADLINHPPFVLDVTLVLHNPVAASPTFARASPTSG